MSHALSVLDRAIQGDPPGLSFLEQTASIYVLDAATASGRPTTYGWWNFLNDALNDVERYESEGRHMPHRTPGAGGGGLDGHVRLLATITRRKARRSPSSDRRLVGTCLANASASHVNLLADPSLAQSLLDGSAELRERSMGRVAAIALDFSFHRGDVGVRRPRSAFSDPAAMEGLCGAVAADAVSTGPAAVRHLVSGWIAPSVDSLPPLAVAAIMSHVAMEAMGKGSPAGMRDTIKLLAPSVLKCALGPILLDSLRESDERGDDAMPEAGGAESIERRTAALALRGIESWCKANSIGAVKLRSIFSSTNVNILEAIADALYSNAEVTIDAVSDLIETLLEYDVMDATVSLGISITRSVMGNFLPEEAASQLLLAQQVTGENERSRISILSELASAVGLQRFRFAERQSNGDTTVCRCLARTAARVLQESQDLMKNGTLQASPDGVLDLLFKATSHPSVYVCGIAVEALAAVAPSNGDLSTRLLPYLQGKAIIPFHLVRDVDGSYNDYTNFRDRVLTEALAACYDGCATFYLESCGSAIDEFCRASPTPHLPYQLEAALFCMVVVSERAIRGADRRVLCVELERMVPALAGNNFSTTSHPLVMAEMCRFVGKYASCYEFCQLENIFETASDLVLASFGRSVNEYSKHGHLVSTNYVSPLSEASNAFKQLLCSSPAQFSTPAARSALENAWKMPYACHQIAIEDREMLCSGLCAVIVSLPSEQWYTSLDALAQPILSCLNVVTREADQVTGSTFAAGQHQNVVDPIMNRLSNEIRLLATVVRCFIEEDVSTNFSGEERTKITICHRNALDSLLHKSWPSLTHVGKQYCSHEAIAIAVAQLLSDCLSLYGPEGELPLLLEITGLAKSCLIVVAKKKNLPSLAPLLAFMRKFMYLTGSEIEPGPRNNAIHEPIQVMAKNLMLLAYEAVRSCAKTSHDSDASQGIASPMFDTLSSCAKKCPIFLLSLSRDSQPIGEVIRSSLETAPTMLKSNDIEVVLSSIRFLKHLVTSLALISLEVLGEDERGVITPVIESVKHSIQTEVLISASTSACVGISPPEILEPLTGLIETILVYSHWPDIEASVSATIFCSGQIQLGDKAKTVAFEVFKKCAHSEHITAKFAEMISDMWEMHQTDDTGSIAGGEAVLDFVQRYKNS